MVTPQNTPKFRAYRREYYRRHHKRIRERQNEYRRLYYKKNKEKVLAWNRKSYQRNKKKHAILVKRWYWRNKEKAYQYHLKMKAKWPWKYVYRSIKVRCEYKKGKCYNRYGGRGIKCLISPEEIRELWLRDNASSMKKPSIDRIDNNGNYIKENCRFMETSLNSSLQHKNKKILHRLKPLKIDAI